MVDLIKPLFGEDKVANLLVKYNYQLKIDDILAGSIIGIERQQTLVDIGLRQVAFLPLNEIFIQDLKSPNQLLEINNVDEFFILYFKENLVILSMRRLHYIKLWERFKQIDFKNMLLTTHYKKAISSAKIVDFGGLDIYLPNTHLPKYHRRIKVKIKPIKVKILEVKDRKHSIIASSRLAILKNQGPSLYIGQIQTGSILAVKSFGLFLNVYGIKCLLHISEISNKKIENIYTLYKKGDRLKVKIIYINGRQGKIALSAKI